MPNLNRLTWILVVRGIAALAFGILALTLPGLTIFTLLYLFAFYALVDGFAILIAAFTSSQHHEDWWFMLIAGTLSALLGILTLVHPGDMGLVLLFFIAARSLMVGVMEIAFAFGLRRTGASWILLLLGGIVSILFGLALFAAPVRGALALIAVIGIFSIAYGVGQFVMASEVRHWGKHRAAGT